MPSGRKPKPVELKLLQGNPGKRRISDAPAYDSLSERAPDELTPKGKAYWRRVVRHLGPASVVQVTDREALIGLCDMWSTYSDTMALVRAHGPLVKAKNHNPDRSAVIVSPAWRVARDALKELEALWARFGLTPSDRARLEVGGGEREEDPYEAFRRRRG
jgi:P27 family predicted phage terminase small subunit